MQLSKLNKAIENIGQRHMPQTFEVKERKKPIVLGFTKKFINFSVNNFKLTLKKFTSMLFDTVLQQNVI